MRGWLKKQIAGRLHCKARGPHHRVCRQYGRSPWRAMRGWLKKQRAGRLHGKAGGPHHRVCQQYRRSPLRGAGITSRPHGRKGGRPDSEGRIHHGGGSHVARGALLKGRRQGYPGGGGGLEEGITDRSNQHAGPPWADRVRRAVVCGGSRGAQQRRLSEDSEGVVLALQYGGRTSFPQRVCGATVGRCGERAVVVWSSGYRANFLRRRKVGEG